MLYASSKDALRRSLVGLAVEVQGTDLDEISYEQGASCPPDSSPLSVALTRVLVRLSVLDKILRMTS